MKINGARSTEIEPSSKLTMGSIATAKRVGERMVTTKQEKLAGWAATEVSMADRRLSKERSLSKGSQSTEAWWARITRS